MAMEASDLFGMVALNATTLVAVDIDARYRYLVKHTGRDASDTDDSNSALSAWMAPKGTTPIADRAVNDNQYELEDGQEVTIGPGIGTLNLKSAASADAVLLLVRIGTPSNSY